MPGRGPRGCHPTLSEHFSQTEGAIEVRTENVVRRAWAAVHAKKLFGAPPTSPHKLRVLYTPVFGSMSWDPPLVRRGSARRS